MVWSGGNYTKGNNATGGWTGDASLGIGIEAGRHDTQDNDFATGINQCLNKDGSNAATGNLNLGGFIPTNLAAGTAAAPALCAGGDVNTGIFSAAADQIGIATNGTERVRIDASGKVGIGTTAPQSDLDVQTVNTPATAITRYSTAGGPNITFRRSRGTTVGTNTIVQTNDSLGSITWEGANGTDYTPAAAIVVNSDGTPGASNDMPGRLVFFTTADGSGSLSERMRITSDGRVGIGAITPSNALTVVANVSDTDGTGTDQGQLFLADSDLNTQGLILGYRYQGGVAEYARIQVRGGNNLGIQAGGGNVGIGTSSPAYRLQISADSAAKPTTNTWTIASDERLKTNVQPYSKGLDEICQINPITYDYNGKGGMAAGPGGISIIAQDIQSIFPECVGTFRTKLNDEDEEETELLNYNGHAITFALINAVKALNVKVETLQARVAELEA